MWTFYKEEVRRTHESGTVDKVLQEVTVLRNTPRKDQGKSGTTEKRRQTLGSVPLSTIKEFQRRSKQKLETTERFSKNKVIQ